jgi:2-polyprenyl-3-methyl-5-hydroxy-6-metoxy-1,4-benzoquinol methylase
VIDRTFSRFGYRISRASRANQALSSDLEKERNSVEYDAVWSNGDTLSAYVNAARQDLYDKTIAIAAELGFNRKCESIADVGCGPGFFTNMLGQQWSPKKLVGFDFSDAVLHVARSTCPNAIFQQHDIYSPLNERFDVLFCTEVLEHLSYPEKALDNLVTAAGVILLTVPNGRVDTYTGHINYWSLESWKVFLERYSRNYEYNARYMCERRNIFTWIKPAS